MKSQCQYFDYDKDTHKIIHSDMLKYLFVFWKLNTMIFNVFVTLHGF